MNNHLVFFLLAIGAFAAGPASALDIRTHTKMCDASAVALLDDGRFIVANDEDNQLRIYDSETKSPQSDVDLDKFLESHQFKKPEADLEGVTRIGDTLIWIGSHGRNKNGKFRPARHVLFATEQSGEPKGTPYRELAQDLSKAEFNLKDAIRFDDKEKLCELAPKRSGLTSRAWPRLRRVNS